jgi:hypothetical protein
MSYAAGIEPLREALVTDPAAATPQPPTAPGQRRRL